MPDDIGQRPPIGPPVPTRSVSTQVGLVSGWDAAIVIPAKDEECRIAACLDAAAVAIRTADGPTVGIVLVVNNTRDATALRARDWALAERGMPFVLIDCDFAPGDAGVGAARRLGLDTALSHLTAEGVLLTTDADSRVTPGWVAENMQELRTADLICGTVLGDPDEARALPVEIAAHGSAEWDYLAASIRLVALLDPQPHDPAPAHHNPAGASMAVSREVYGAVGGLPVMPIGEDRAFADLVVAQDYRIRFSDRAIVETSCRMTGRTDGGMAGALRARAFERDPWADEWMEAADTLALRHGLRGRLRAAWPDCAALHRVLTEAIGDAGADTVMRTPPGRYFGAFFAAVERTSPRLARIRLRLSDCRRELPRLQRLLADAERDDVPPLARPASRAVAAI